MKTRNALRTLMTTALLALALATTPHQAQASDILLGGQVALGGTTVSDDLAEFSSLGPNFGVSTGVDAALLFRGSSGADIGLQLGWRYQQHSIDDEFPRSDYNFNMSLFSLGPLVRFDLGDLFTLGVGVDVVFGSLTLEYTVNADTEPVLNGVNPAVIGFQMRLEGIFRIPVSNDGLSVFYVGPILSFNGMRHEDIDIFDPEPPFNSFFQSDQESTYSFTFSAVAGFTYEFQSSSNGTPEPSE